MTKSQEGFHIDDLFIEDFVLKKFHSNNNFALRNLKLIKKDEPNYSFKIENIELQNKKSILKNKYLKNINDISLKDIIFDFNVSSFDTNIRGKILLNKYINNFSVNGTLKNLKDFDGNLMIDIDSFPLLTLLKNNTYIKNNYKVNNSSSLLFTGKLTAEVKDNGLEKANIKIFSQINTSDFFLTNTINNSKINIEDISFEGKLNKNIYEIKKLNINKDKENLKITGKLYNNFKSFLLKINLDKIKYNSINNFLNNSLDESLKSFGDISKVNINKVKDIKLMISNNNNKSEINIINSDLENIKLITKKNIKIHIKSAKIIKKNKSIKFYGSDIKTEGTLGSSYFSTLTIFSSDFNNINNNIELKTNVSTNYKFLNLILSEFDINQSFPKNLEGEVSGFLKISKDKNDNFLSFFFEGSLEKFYNFEFDNEDMPIVLSEFNGKVLLTNDIIKIEGIGSINGSTSDIKISVDKYDILTATIEIEAQPSSLNFLGKYNFIEQGNSKLKVLITKDINSKKWKANFEANLFSNEIKIGFINFFKPVNKRGSIAGSIYFDGQNIIKVDQLDFLTEELLVSTNILFKDQNKLDSIFIDRFIKDKNNFKANIKFIENNYYLIDVEGESLDFKSLVIYGEGKHSNIRLNLDVDNVYYDDVYFGKTFIKSELINGTFIKLSGNISDDNNIYIRFTNNLDEKSEYNKVNIEFDDFGYFLKKSSLLDTFIEGEGTATLKFKKLNLLSGKLEISNSSIKNSSFLARLLQMASFTGLLEILTNEGIPFDKIIINFTKNGSIINIKEARLQGFSLGGNFKGFTILDKQEVDLEGIIVPAYAINSVINKIPLIGQVITGIEGDGLIGVNFKVTGNYDKLNYNVNPLSILTPGIIRSMFDSIFELNDENKTNE